MIFNLEKIKERRKERYEKYRKMWKDEIKSIVREAMDEWTADCSVSYTHLTLPTKA